MQVAKPAIDGFKFGCDPELFVLDADGEPVSAEGLIPGTKEEPYKVEHGAVQVDGMAAEFNIDPASSFEEFNGNIVAVLKQLKGMLPTGYKLRAVPSMVFSEKIWDATPDIAKALGCTPDYDAWTGEVNPPPEDLVNPRMRCAGGHIHIGWTEGEELSDIQHIMNCRDLIRQLDWYLGGWSVRVDPDPTRRRLYGRAGACRYKPYGVEYRVLSNFWVAEKEARLTVWNRLQAAIEGMRKEFYPDLARKDTQLLIERINNSERDGLFERKFHFPLISVNK